MTDYPLSTTLPAAGDGKIALANDLHRQCRDLAGQVQALGQRMWQTAVVLGYTLVCIKAETPHGEYKQLFKSPKNSTCGVFDFSYSAALRYVNLYKSVEARARKLGDDQAAAMRQMIEQGSADELSSLLGEVSQASSLREAYIELGVIQPPKSPQQITEERAANLRAHHNTLGRPRKPEMTADEALEATRRVNEEELMRLCGDLSRYITLGRHNVITRQGQAAALDVLLVATSAIKALKF